MHPHFFGTAAGSPPSPRNAQRRRTTSARRASRRATSALQDCWCGPTRKRAAPHFWSRAQNGSRAVTACMLAERWSHPLKDSLSLEQVTSRAAVRSSNSPAPERRRAARRAPRGGAAGRAPARRARGAVEQLLASVVDVAAEIDAGRSARRRRPRACTKMRREGPSPSPRGRERVAEGRSAAGFQTPRGKAGGALGGGDEAARAHARAPSSPRVSRRVRPQQTTGRIVRRDADSPLALSLAGTERPALEFTGTRRVRARSSGRGGASSPPWSPCSPNARAATRAFCGRAYGDQCASATAAGAAAGAPLSCPAAAASSAEDRTSARAARRPQAPTAVAPTPRRRSPEPSGRVAIRRPSRGAGRRAAERAGVSASCAILRGGGRGGGGRSSRPQQRPASYRRAPPPRRARVLEARPAELSRAHTAAPRPATRAVALQPRPRGGAARARPRAPAVVSPGIDR